MGNTESSSKSKSSSWSNRKELVQRKNSNGSKSWDKEAVVECGIVVAGGLLVAGLWKLVCWAESRNNGDDRGSSGNNRAVRGPTVENTSQCTSRHSDRTAAVHRESVGSHRGLHHQSGAGELRQDSHCTFLGPEVIDSSQHTSWHRDRPVAVHQESVGSHCRHDHQSGAGELRPAADCILLGSKKRTIKIMTYNVWFRNVLQRPRMQAICDLVQKHKPDIIFFQEITPIIYKIFEDFGLWKDYKCPPPERVTEGNFCILASQLPLRDCVSKSYTRCGKLTAGVIEVGPGDFLIVATSHLKRAERQVKNSEKRRAQATEAIKFLDRLQNVVFGGDMNWDESIDGRFPLCDGWVDASATLYPNKDGYTYDTKSNPALEGRRLLRKRFDRFVCKLQDYRLVGVKMIGTESIPGYQCYSKDARKCLPVLPSDHFGLLLAIHSK